MLTHRHLRLHLLRLKPRKEWETPREGLLFLFIGAGVGEYLSDSSTQPLVQPLSHGDVLILHASSTGKIRATFEAELAFHVFSLCIEDLYPILVADEISLVKPLMNSFKAPRFYPATSSAALGWHRLIRDVPSEFDLEHRSQLLRVAGAILSGEFNKLRRPHFRYESTDTRVTRLFEQISTEHILNLSVTELARRFKCSQRHLNRLFKEHFGLSVGALRMEMRMLKVVSLLRNPNFKIIHVAEQGGFNHLGLFNTCFKRRFGVSPGQWRKNLEADNESAPALVAGPQSCRLRAVGLCPLPEMPVGQKAEVESLRSEADGS